jgi:predicted  nucleic acid-binding Zn-ribbon protein
VPSVKSYQKRKADIKKLNEQLAESEYQLRKLQQEYRVGLAMRDKEIANLYKEVQVARSQADLFGRRLNTSEELRTSLSKIIDALSKKVEELERKVRIYRQYIRYGVAFYPEQYTVTIPSFMKPFDSVAFVQKVSSEFEV